MCSVRTGSSCRMCDFSSTAGSHERGSSCLLARSGLSEPVGYHRRVAEESAQPLSEQLEEIRTQLAWVRDYL